MNLKNLPTECEYPERVDCGPLRFMIDPTRDELMVLLPAFMFIFMRFFWVGGANFSGEGSLDLASIDVCAVRVSDCLGGAGDWESEGRPNGLGCMWMAILRTPPDGVFFLAFYLAGTRYKAHSSVISNSGFLTTGFGIGVIHSSFTTDNLESGVYVKSFPSDDWTHLSLS